MIFQTNYNLLSFYEQNRLSIDAEVSGGKDVLYQEMERRRNNFTRLNYFDPVYFTTLAEAIALLTEVQRSTIIDTTRFVKAETLLPVPQSPDFFQNHVAEKEFFRIISEYPPLKPYRSIIKKIIAISDLKNKQVPLRSNWDGQNCSIHGYNDYSFLSLSRIIHEIGHCIFESAFKIRHWKQQLLSEAFAGLLEEKLSLHFLTLHTTKKECEHWCAYQRTIDILNIYCCLYEAKHFFNFTVKAALNTFKKPTLVLRESLYILPGYQLAYLASTLMKKTGANFRCYFPFTKFNPKESNFLSHFCL